MVFYFMITFGAANLFNSILEETFRQNWLQGIWNKNRLEIYEHFRFADDVKLISENYKKIHKMIKELNY